MTARLRCYSRAAHDARIYTSDAATLGERLSTDVSRTAAIDLSEVRQAVESFRRDDPGQVSNVGVSGYTLGGGVGWIGRKVGAACHAVVSATVVLADGLVVTASESENPDLLWALKGGGDNFGVVASLTVGLVPLTKIFGGMAYYNMKDAPEVLRFYREWTAELGNDTSTTLRLMRLPPKPHFLLHGLMETCALGVCHTDEATAEELHRRITELKKPALDDLKLRPYSEMAGFDEASETKGSPTYGDVECLRELTDDVLDGLVRVAQERIPPLMQVELQQLGGELRAERSDATAYTAPQAPFILHVVSPAMDASLAELALATKEPSAHLARPTRVRCPITSCVATSRRVCPRRSGPGIYPVAGPEEPVRSSQPVPTQHSS